MSTPTTTPTPSHFLVVALGSQHLTIVSSNGRDVSGKFQELFEDAGDSLSCVQWITSSSVDNCVAFWAQGEGVGYLDLVKKSIDAPCGNVQHIGDEFSGVCQDSQGRFWTAVSSYGQTAGVVLDSDGDFSKIGFGRHQGGDSGDDEGATERGNETDDDDDDGDCAPISMASLHPLSQEIVVASRESVLRCYQPDGTKSRTIALPRRSKALGVVASCIRNSKEIQPPESASPSVLLVVLIEALPAPAATPPPPPSDNGKARRMMKVLRQADRQIIVVNVNAAAEATTPPTTAVVVKTYSPAQLSQRGNVPVSLTSLPDGSVIVGMSDDAPLRIWPAKQGTTIAPLVPKDSPATRLLCGASSFAAVVVTKDYLEDVEKDDDDD